MTERGILRRLIEEAFVPYIDPTLEGRVERAASKWQRQAQAEVDAKVDAAAIAELQEEAERMREQVDRINDELDTAAADVELPEVEVPQSRIDLDSLDDGRQAVIKFDTDWLTATRTLIARKQYLGENGDE